MQNLCRDYIFPSFVYSMDLEDVNNSHIINDCLQIKNNTRSVLKSNRGGWQSLSICEKLKTSSLDFLEQKVVEAVQFVLNAEKINNIKFKSDYWININGTNSYNVIHNHADYLITAVYYPFVPKDCEVELVFTRTDGGSYFYLNANTSRFNVLCKTSMLVVFSPHLFHYVTPNNSKEDRISIAFNFERVKNESDKKLYSC